MSALNDPIERAHFEEACFAYYADLKGRGWSHPAEGDFTPEALFWKTPAGKYGVAQIEAAWNGWKMKARQMQPERDFLIRRVLELERLKPVAVSLVETMWRELGTSNAEDAMAKLQDLKSLVDRKGRPELPQVYELADDLYNAGYADRKHERDQSPRGCDEWQRVVDAILIHNPVLGAKV